MLLRSFITCSARIRPTTFPQRVPPPQNLTFKFFALTSFATSSSGPTEYQKLQMAVTDKVESAIANNKVVIFSKSWCPYCSRAKTTLKSRVSENDIAIFELDEMEDGTEIQNYLHGKTNQRTVPNIFIRQIHIGGNDALQSKLEDRNDPIHGLLAQ
ncbi:hypothetical protein CTheo_5654 [Ceratobasidium theobromae]|uniref:Glutaredoxin domain-containing protein n=1 Tax=Ceratobasidium theobromae TaxID=1582974 RepID=A0A5N5QGL6_9AGAM|nr:hypothetical protein CTheo_5654 [Ceratobasidium theobromae]